ncbi:phosphodiester glycosidase family protein [Pontixanthobacter gangjinensis]|uniref:phosphodiester glycosidase family protein n=1 Tax=Pontixanthobacter gangjinensis TaxID=1028742 RepID=UPI002E266515
MKKLILLAALSVLSACNPEPEGQPVLRTEIGSGVAEEAEIAAAVRASACKTITFEGEKFTDCIADPAKHTITTALGPKGKEPYRSLANLAGGRGSDAPLIAFAVNGGMFDKAGKPIGYYVENGSRTKELSRTDGPGNFHLKPNGVFFGSRGKWDIRTSDDFYSNVGDRPNFGTQSGPMLVIDGKIHPEITENGPSKAVRNGVGVDAEGRAHFVISAGPISFGVLARLYRDQLKTPDALFLDGNVSALWDPASDRLDMGAPLGPMIVVEMKE